MVKELLFLVFLTAGLTGFLIRTALEHAVCTIHALNVSRGQQVSLTIRQTEAVKRSRSLSSITNGGIR